MRDAGEAVSRGALQHAFRALRHRNFRLFLGGQAISVTGTWMQQIALSWLVYRLTRSAFLLGLVGFASQFPNLLLSPLAGVWADRWNRHRMVIATQSLGMLQALALALLTFSGRVQIGHLIALAAFIGVVNGVDTPARQAFLVEMVEGREDLGNAIALNSSVFNAARLVGPTVAGILVALVGEGPVFLLNGVSYLAVILALVAMRLPGRPEPAGPRAPLVRTFAEGLAYSFGFLPIRSLLLLVGLVSLFGIPFTVLLPIFATERFGGGANTLGFLMGAMGIGALAGALALAARRTVRGLGRVIVVAVVMFGASVAGFAFVRSSLAGMALLAAAGFGMMVQMAASNTILQTIVDEDKRGRVISLYVMAFLGVSPVGSLLAGAVASRVGAPVTVAVGGLTCLLGAVAFARAIPAIRAEVRPIYTRLGIIPEVAAGLQTATEPSVRGSKVVNTAGERP